MDKPVLTLEDIRLNIKNILKEMKLIEKLKTDNPSMYQEQKRVIDNDMELNVGEIKKHYEVGDDVDPQLLQVYESVTGLKLTNTPPQVLVVNNDKDNIMDDSKYIDPFNLFIKKPTSTKMLLLLKNVSGSKVNKDKDIPSVLMYKTLLNPNRNEVLTDLSTKMCKTCNHHVGGREMCLHMFKLFIIEMIDKVRDIQNFRKTNCISELDAIAIMKDINSKVKKASKLIKKFGNNDVDDWTILVNALSTDLNQVHNDLLHYRIICQS